MSQPSSRQCVREQQVDNNNGSFQLTWRTTQPLPRDQFFYDMGRDSPGALLDMLAEVASQTLHSEKKLSELDKNSKAKESKKKNNNNNSQLVTFNVTQLLTMPATQLVKLFSVFSSDELKRQYTYSCALVPGCGQSYTSFASEGRARMSIKSHLADHLQFLKSNADTYASFTASTVKYTKPKSSVQNRKTKIQTKKPHKETLNKENKDTKVGKSTNYLRKILSNEMNIKEFETNGGQEKVNHFVDPLLLEVKKEQSDVKVLGDHSYFEHVKEDIINGESTSTISRVPVNSLTNENIMLMVVDSNGVCVKDSSNTVEDTSESLSTQENEVNADMTLWKDDTYTAPAEAFVPAKPKGKAKFIGTSKEEREMALILIEKIRKKGNPTGNNLQCRICDPPRSFTAPTTLVSHYRSHAGIKPYECRICRAVFTRRHSLKYHMLIHQNQTRFTCADCGKKFRHPSHFREHRRRHTGEAPFGCEDCGQRFKTRNTYKRHLKTRHGKVLTITGELLNLSEEDSKKVRTKNRRKKQDVSESIINETVNTTENLVSDPQGQEFQWEEQQVSNNITESAASSVEQCIDNAIWMYQNQPNGITHEDYSEIQEKSPNIKTEFNETEIATNFDSNGVVIAQTDSDGTLHFENYNYAQDTLYTNSNTMHFTERSVCTDMTDAPKDYETQEESIVEFQESTENYTETVEPIYNVKTEVENSVFVLDGEEVVTSNSVENSELKNVVSTSNSTQTEDTMEVGTDTDEQPLNMIPCQIKVCDDNGAATLQFINNSNIVLGNKTQSINLIQNGKQHTILLLASGDNNLLGVENGVIEGSKPLPVIAVPAE